MTSHTKRYLDAAVDELKRNGYMVLVVLMDQKADESKPMGSAMEVLCSETDDPQVLAGMLKATMDCLSHPHEPQLTN